MHNSKGRWCRGVELNHRPRPYQGRALPLSYRGISGKVAAKCHRLLYGASIAYLGHLTIFMRASRMNKMMDLQ